MDVKDIGIKKNRVLISTILILVALAFVITFIFMWWDYASQGRTNEIRNRQI